MTRAVPLAALGAVALALGACSNLPDVAAGVCGNGVVDPGEDCDGDATAAGGTCGTSGANACHFTCDTTTACPTGYACGGDGRCRAPSATFAVAPGPYAFDASSYGTGDVDGDGTADLIGVSTSALSVRFGDAKADLASSSSQPVRKATAPIVFGDLDGDGRTDVLLPAAVGVFAFLADGAGFNPFPYTSIQLADKTSPVRTASIQAYPDVVTQMIAIEGKVMAFINSAPQYAACIDGGAPPLCLASTHDASQLLDDIIPRGRTGLQYGAFVGAADTTDEFVIAFKGDDHVVLWSPAQPGPNGNGGYDPTTLAAQPVETVALPKSGTGMPTQVRVADTGGAFFGRFDDDPCVDLLIPTKRSELTAKFQGFAIAYGARVGGVCTGQLEPTATLVAEAQLDASGASKGLIPRAAADVDGDGVTDVVTDQLITVTSCTRQRTGCKNGVANQFAMDFRSFTPRAWTGALATDINGDGKVDLAGFVAGQVDVDVLLGAQFGIFNHFPIATDLPPRYLRTGDFDGDLVADVAVVTGDTTAGTGEDDELAVIYGASAGGPSAPVSMGTFGVVQDVEPASILTDVQSIDAITDLLVIADRAGTRGVAPLIGDSSRRLLAPYLLNEGSGTTVSNDEPVAIQLGQFDDSPDKDVIVLAKQTSAAGPVASLDLRPRIFLLSGTGGGNLVGGAPYVPTASPTSFEFRNARWTSTKMTASDTKDDLVGVDASDDKRTDVLATSPHVFVAHPPAQSGAGWTFDAPVAVPDAYAALRVRGIATPDLDGDGDGDLVIDLMPATAAATGTTPGTAIVAWNQGGSFAVAQAAGVLPAGQTCQRARAVQLDLDPAKELATICVDAAGQATVVFLDWNGTAWVTLGSLAVGSSDLRIGVGDFNGDKLDDLAITSGTGPGAVVSIYTQCTLGDTSCAIVTTAAVAGTTGTGK